MDDSGLSTRIHKGGSLTWALSAPAREFIRSHVKPGHNTLETGSGASTIAFLEAGARHIAVSPDAEERDALLQEIALRGLEAEKLDFRVGPSQLILPFLPEDLQLDAVLVDGGHGFPLPAVDWLYAAMRMKPGAVMLIDDVDLWSGGMLVDFLKAEPGWDHLGTPNGRTAIFRMTAPFELKEWTGQPHTYARSKWRQRARKVGNFADLVVRGEFSTALEKVAKERQRAAASI